MSSDFWLVAGLGNPGAKYRGTRHNIGFAAANELAARWDVKFSNHKGLADLGKGTMSLHGETRKFFLAKPLTYMNESGQAVESIREYYHIDAGHIIVIHDDMDLDFGRIKLKKGGSSGGHNGIKSIDRCLHTPDYFRVRMGTGHSSRGGDAHENSINFVLGKFNKAQEKQMPAFLADAADATEAIMFEGLAKAQDVYNVR